MGIVCFVAQSQIDPPVASGPQAPTRLVHKGGVRLSLSRPGRAAGAAAANDRMPGGFFRQQWRVLEMANRSSLYGELVMSLLFMHSVRTGIQTILYMVYSDYERN